MTEIFFYLNYAFEFFVRIALPEVSRWLFFLSVLWLPIVLFEYAWSVWVKYVRYAWFVKQEALLLEIKLPQETLKSPAAMELVLTGLYQTSGEGTPLDRYWEGKVRAWFSLEIASFGGELHLYIWTFKGLRNIVESNIYAQYPDVEIHEVKDYTKDVFFDPAKYDIFATRLEATGPDPLPIKTYVDYGLEKDPKEEYKIDPMSPLLEFMGSIQKDHQLWVQMVIRAHTQEKTPLNDKYPDKWKDEAKELIQKIINEAVDEEKDKDGKVKKVPNLIKFSSDRKNRIEAIERSLTKFPFDVGIRLVYIAPREIFNKGYGAGLMGSFKQFNALNLNGFKPAEVTSFDYKWQDWSGKKLLALKTELFQAYCLRSFFHYPYKRKWTVLNTEELATLYHFPGSTVKTPTLNRIPSKRADAPANLPV